MKLLHTGAFAKLCGVRKGTLLFYDKEGGLRPKNTSPETVIAAMAWISIMNSRFFPC